MSEQCNSTSAAALSPLPDGHVVSIRVANDHPLLQLKRALNWEAIQAVMVKHWRKTGRNVDGGPGLPWPVDLYVPLVVLMGVKPLDSRQVEMVSSDTTVQEPAIGYPNEAGIMRGVAQRVYRSLVKVKEKGLEAVEAGKEKAKELFKTVKEYHLFARTPEQKGQLLHQLVAQTGELIAHSQEVIRQVGRSAKRVTQSAVREMGQMIEVSATLLPQIGHWLQTGVVARGKILHAGITQARAIVKNKAGKRVEFGLKWLVNRIEGGYVFGRVVEAGADERAMPIEAMKDYQRVFGAQAVPKMSVYDRGGSAPKTIEALKRQGIEKVGIPPRGKAKWCVAEADQPQVRSQRGKTEGVIGTLKSRKYGFNHRTERSNETLIAAGQRVMVCLNLNKLMRDVVGKEKKAQVATA